MPTAPSNDMPATSRPPEVSADEESPIWLRSAGPPARVRTSRSAGLDGQRSVDQPPELQGLSVLEFGRASHAFGPEQCVERSRCFELPDRLTDYPGFRQSRRLIALLYRKVAVATVAVFVLLVVSVGSALATNPKPDPAPAALQQQKSTSSRSSSGSTHPSNTPPTPAPTPAPVVTPTAVVTPAPATSSASSSAAPTQSSSAPRPLAKPEHTVTREKAKAATKARHAKPAALKKAKPVVHVAKPVPRPVVDLTLTTLSTPPAQVSPASDSGSGLSNGQVLMLTLGVATGAALVALLAIDGWRRFARYTSKSRPVRERGAILRGPP